MTNQKWPIKNDQLQWSIKNYQSKNDQSKMTNQKMINQKWSIKNDHQISSVNQSNFVIKLIPPSLPVGD